MYQNVNVIKCLTNVMIEYDYKETSPIEITAFIMGKVFMFPFEIKMILRLASL